MQSPSKNAVIATAQDTTTLKSIFFVSNIHCSSCVTYITEIFSEITGVRSVDVSILTPQVCVVHTTETTPLNLATALIQAAFEVHHVTTEDERGVMVSDLDTTSSLPRNIMLFTAQQDSHSKGAPQDRHIANCDACRKEELKSDSVTVSCVSKAASSQSVEASKFKARLSIGGMSCASCVNTITNELIQLDFVEDVVVNLLTNSATVVYNGLQKNSGKLVDQIEDIGFEAALDEVEMLNDPSTSKKALMFTAEIAIGGMTCGSCSGAVTRGLEELPFVKEVSVNLLSHSGKVEFEGQKNVDLILEKIEDLGYDASITSVQASNHKKDEVESRTISIRVDGMFCHHCPEKVLRSLKDIPGLEVDDALSVKNPILQVTYKPCPPILTIRSIIDLINKAHDAFTASVYHPPSIEDRSRAMQLHERRRLLSRLLFVLTVAIPTFLIGIVFMSLVSSDNHVRKYLEGSIWVGNVSRIEWALFIMSTPVMFYGTDIFHVRAIKEIYSLWRPGSRVPILRRFYRFGSMNLLISAGTMVAYVSSLAVLIVDAVVAKPSDNTHSMTYFDSVIFLTLFILAGRFIEAYSKAKTGDAVASLGKLKPSDALLVVSSDNSGDEIQRTGLDLLEIGDMVSIPHGSSPPADGTLVDDGSYQFDESSLTGESKPVKKSSGDPVYTGSVNVGQPVKIKVTALGSASMLDQIISVVREGQSRRAPLERVADMLTSHFVPIITLIAISTFVIWLSLGLSGVLPVDYLDVPHGGWVFWSLEFAIAVFVVACPCGLALAAPTALFVGGGLAARRGILVKGGGEAFQEASHLDAIVFDKTGTLTEGGSLAVSDHEVLLTDPEHLQVAWTLAQKLEESSTHPIARAITDFCRQRSSIPILSSDIEERPGQGLRGIFIVQKDSVTTVKFEAAIGNQRLLQSMSSQADDDHLNSLLSKYQMSGKSTAIFSMRQISESTSEHIRPVIVFGISDTIRQDTVQVISKLQKRKVNVFMCTGDNQTTAYAVADMIGIPRSNVKANVTPAGKGEFVRQVQDGLVLSGPPRSDSEAESQQTENKSRNAPASRSIVAFVGDGVNDSPALAAADVSIAMASGSDVAMNSASFILLNSELDTILQLVVLSRRVFTRVKMNFCWAVVYNLSLIPIAAGVLYPIVNGHSMQMGPDGGSVMVNTHWRLSPVWAALAMALSSISVVLSSLALGIQWRKIGKWLSFGLGSK
ncbi:putative copper resistance-associated P-type ATPase [Aspergillus affinis]|uniref:putative copper resistance-associated P-type ATPase n=1 Tax=Aspergillus affinis TaxID=1070780 RepID=UPI0022FE5735|nr:copper resistance-associated P-type ATPase [Aspergillus affinis]KAI9043684.1 copper resistance-associated P-type ATPase [Aspergillus affinis]